MKLRLPRRALVAVGIIAALVLAGFAISWLHRLLTPCFGMPNFEVYIDGKLAWKQTGFVPVGYDINYYDSYRDGDDTTSLVSIYSVQMWNMWNMDTFMMEKRPNDIIYSDGVECMTMDCHVGKLEKAPYSFTVYRMTIDELGALSVSPEQARDSAISPLDTFAERVEVQKRGTEYRIYDPELNCVYIARSVSDGGVYYFAWLLMEEA